MTALEVGDDDSALAAADALERLQGNLDDPYVESATQLAMSWALPIRGDIEGALEAATSSLRSFRQQDEPFMAANAAFTLGMLELVRSRHEQARQHLSEVRSLGKQLGSNWLTAVSSIQLSTIEADAGQLDAAYALLVDSLAGAGAERSTLTVTFCLVAVARLALARNDGQAAAVALGAANGLREQAGLRAWPMVRSSEADLIARVEASLNQADFSAGFNEGARLNLREAVGVIRGEDPPKLSAD
jgi:ATP/maltotriose-dependent transcriptional regulator MalT